MLAFVFLILAMVDFLGGKEEMKIQQKVNSVIFLLDVSNSMNAQDIEPSRLETSKKHFDYIPYKIWAMIK